MAREVVEVIVPADLDSIPDGATYQKIAITEAARLASCDENAEVNPSGLEMQSAIVGLADGDRVLVGSEPQSGEKKVYGIHFNAAGNTEYDREDTAEV